MEASNPAQVSSAVFTRCELQPNLRLQMFREGLMDGLVVVQAWERQVGRRIHGLEYPCGGTWW